MMRKAALHQRLTFRIVLFLTLALVPLGAISIALNQRLFEEARLNAELSLLALTKQAVSGERDVILQTFGAARTLGEIFEGFEDDVEACRTFVQSFMNSNARFVFAGLTDLEGSMQCSSAPEIIDLLENPVLVDYVETPRSRVSFLEESVVTGGPVLVLTEPRIIDGELRGFVSVSLALNTVGDAFDFLGTAAPRALVTFNEFGDLLSAEPDRSRASALLPFDTNLADLAYGPSRRFEGQTSSGETLVYSVVPIRQGVVYALGVWPKSLGDRQPAGPILNAFLPFLMWVASVFVVWFVIDRFVLRGIRTLNADMRQFSTNRQIPNAPSSDPTLDEFARLQTQFRTLAQEIMRDEEELEGRLDEKSILLKEVHHRVRNNLQIISSIMNMQIRNASETETKTALRQVQDRVMRLSGVHRTLYQAENLNQVDVTKLIEELVQQSPEIGSRNDVTIEQSLQHVTLLPDQAVPFALLVTEALANAMKHLGGDDPTIVIRMTIDDVGLTTLQIENSRHREVAIPTVPTGGLAEQLITALSTQLGGQLDVDVSAVNYRMKVTFKVEDFLPGRGDY